MKGNEITEV
ncbi:hypothetical protein YPPY113_1112, partial [Yersinia pestis PY-113]